jgi:hypothetical protein
MTTLELKLIEGHLFFNVEGNLWLVDTGAPLTLGNQRTLTLAGITVPTQSTYLGATVEQIAELARVPFAGLIGQDLLLQTDIVFDLPRQQARIATLPTLRVPGEPVELQAQGIPLVPVETAGQRVWWWLDTGAQLGYFQRPDLLTTFEPAGKARDFFPGVGEFEVDTFRVPVQIGTIAETHRAGLLPPPLGPLLELTGTAGILGTELFAGRQVGFFPLRRELVLGRRTET